MCSQQTLNLQCSAALKMDTVQATATQQISGFSFFFLKQDTVLTQMVERISVPVGFVSKPSVVRGGRAAMCVLRLASAKELQKKGVETSNKSLKPDSETPTSQCSSSTEESKDLKQQ